MLAQDEILSGRYLLKEELGTGGMGTVYRAVDLRTGADVAVKVPHRYLVKDLAYVERLRREAEIAAALHSPRVARVTDFAEHEGVPYIVMEYVPGEPLARVIHQRGALPPDLALHIAHEVARALDAAHQRGITHRDLKPQNIHLDDTDVKVLDFGIARLEGQSSLTAAGAVTGSPEYMAPERVEGPGDVRSDIYALGIVLYEMLTGKAPFDGGTPWSIMRRQASEPPPPLPPGLPAGVYPVVERCLAKDPNDRFQTPRELITALQDALRGDAQPSTLKMHTGDLISGSYPRRPDTGENPVAPLIQRLPSQERPAGAPPPPVSPAATLTAHHRPRWPLFVAAGAVAVIILAVLAFLLTRGGGGSSPSAASASNTATAASASPRAIGTGTSGTVAAGSATPAPQTGGTPTLSIGYPRDGAEVTSPVRVQVAVDGVTLRPPTDNVPDARHLHYFIDTDPRAVLVPGAPIPTGQSNIIHTAATSQTVELGPGAHTVWVVMTDNNHIPLTPPIDTKVSFTVTGTPARTGEQAPIVYQSLVGGKWRLFVMDGNGRNARRVSNDDSDNVEPSFSPDGSRIVFASSRDGKFHLWVMNADGSNVQQLTSGNATDRSPAWSPDGSRIAFSSDREGGLDQIYVIPAAGGAARQVTSSGDGGSGPSWSPDGTEIAYYGVRGNVTHIYVVDAAGGQPKQLTTASQRHIEPAWSPDGQRIAYAAFRDNRWNIYLMNADGSNVQQVTNEDYNQYPAWSPDGRQLVFVSGREGQQQVFKLPVDGGQTVRLTEGLAQNLHPSWRWK
jgi:serine/threonine-protein kinase